MNASSILITNVVVKVDGIETPQRVLFVNPQTDAIAHIAIDGASARPCVSRLSLWSTLEEAGGLQWVDDPYTELPFQHAISPSMAKRKATAWHAIEPLVATTDILERSKCFGMIANRADELGIHKHSVRNWLVEYWQKGQTPGALFGARNKAGGRGKRRVKDNNAEPTATSSSESEKKRGAPRSILPGVGINISLAHTRIITVAIKRYYHKNRHTSYRYTYVKMLRSFFPGAVSVDDKGRVKIVAPELIITYRQFMYWAKKCSTPEIDTVARRGRTFFEKTLRPLLGNVTNDAIGPGYRYQIDATIADVYLVSSLNRQTNIGRPVVYVVIDVWSRLIIGIYVGLENASWPTAMMALHNATVDKVEWCKSYDIEIAPKQWPTAGLSSIILGDRGEMLSQHADQLASVLGISVENTPPYRADWKGVVERMFGTLQAKFAPETPAYVPKDYMPRLDHDHRLDAALTLREFTQILIHCVLDHNSSTISGYPMHTDMVKDGVAPIPVELWKWGIQNRMGAMVAHSQEKILFGLLPTGDATISDSGLIFLKRTYQSTEPHVRAWFTTARRRGTRKVRVSYYPHDLDTVLVHDDTHIGSFVILKLTSEDSTVWKLCVEEVICNSTADSKNIGAVVQDVLETKMTHQLAIDKITSKALEGLEALGPDHRSKKEKTSNIRANKRVEKALTRLNDSSATRTPSDSPTPPPQPVSNSPARTYSLPQLSDLRDDD